MALTKEDINLIQTALQTNFDNIKIQLNNLKDNIGQVENSVFSFEGNFFNIDDKFSNLDNRFSDIDVKFNNLDDKFSNFENNTNRRFDDINKLIRIKFKEQYEMTERAIYDSLGLVKISYASKEDLYTIQMRVEDLEKEMRLNRNDNEEHSR